MFSLIAATTVLTRLKLPQDAALEQTISDCISAASPFLEALTLSCFDSQENEDIFRVDPNAFMAVGGTLRLRLSSGFVRKDAPVRVYYSDTLEGLQLAAQEVPVIKTDYIHGQVVVQEQYGEAYFRVEYSSGFEELTEVPGWLQECAYIQTLMNMSFIDLGDDTPVATIYADMKGTMGRLLDAHVRVGSFTVAPFL